MHTLSTTMQHLLVTFMVAVIYFVVARVARRREIDQLTYPEIKEKS